MPKSTPRFHIPYPSDLEDPFYVAFESMVRFLDQLNFGQFEDVNEIVYSDGVVSWDIVGGNYILSFNSDVNFVSPSFGRIQTLPVTTPPLDIQIPVNHYLIFDLTRGSTVDVDLSTKYTVQTQLPIDATHRILCYHASNHKLYFTTNLVLDVGDTSSSMAPSGGGGASAFTALSDTPNNYTGHGGEAVRVNAGETDLEFYTASGGSTASPKFIVVPIDTSAPSFTSTATIPMGSVVLRVYVKILAPYGSTNDIDVVIQGGSGFIPVMSASEIDGDVVGISEGLSLDLVGIADSGPVVVTVSGLTVGGSSGYVFVEYVENLLT